MHTTASFLEETKQLNSTSLADFKGFKVLSGAIENFIDGIVVLTKQGKCVYANASAHRIFQQLLQGMSPPNLVPKEVLGMCQPLTESQIVVSNEKLVTEAQISKGKLGAYRLRAKWLSLGETEPHYLLVIIEDRCQSLQSLVKSEANSYCLTRSEAEVWLLRRGGYSNKEIAEKLYISINTVKKHMKNILAKRKAFLEVED